MKREQLQSLFDSWQKMPPAEQASLAARVNMSAQDETTAAFGVAFQQAKRDFQQARDAAIRSARATAPTGKVTAPNTLA